MDGPDDQTRPPDKGKFLTLYTVRPRPLDEGFRNWAWGLRRLGEKGEEKYRYLLFGLRGIINRKRKPWGLISVIWTPVGMGRVWGPLSRHPETPSTTGERPNHRESNTCTHKCSVQLSRGLCGKGLERTKEEGSKKNPTFDRFSRYLFHLLGTFENQSLSQSLFFTLAL